MTIFLGSTNPVKINAARRSAGDHWSDLQVHGFDVKSGVSEQPITDAETRTGAQNRAQAALAAGLTAHPTQTGAVVGMGMEGGVFTDETGQMWSTVWVCVVDTEGGRFEANGGRIPVASVIAELIAKGQEMGPVMAQLVGEADIKHKQGMFGVVTNNFVTRTDEYASIAQIALGQWFGRGWDDPLRKQ